MKKKNKLQTVKNFIKLLVASGLVVLFIVLGFFVKTTHTFENSNMNRWATLTDSQKTDTLHKVVPSIENEDLLMACMNKISTLNDSGNMIVQSAISLCHNGIKLNEAPKEDEKK